MLNCFQREKNSFSKEKRHRFSELEMQILEPIRNTLRILGMSSQHSVQKYPINARNLTSLFIHGINVTCSIGYIISGTENMEEFVSSLFVCITAIFDTLLFINLNWNMRRLFELIDKLENTVEKSKCNKSRVRAKSIFHSNVRF